MIKYYMAIIYAVIGLSIPDGSMHVAPEICDNGLDDDMDGLIDLNDTLDCPCTGISDSLFIPASIIPNYSFEDTLCCPQWLQQLSCAKNWIQASRATSDYYHTCGYSEDRTRGRPPLPLPSGDAYVGFLDIWWQDTIIWKEYIGACLDKPIEVNKDYRLQFYLGFSIGGEQFNSESPVTVVLYGTDDCNQLPFGDANFTDCPVRANGWFEIARVTLSGRAEWVRATMNFTVNRDIRAVAIGPPCVDPPGRDYYFVDELLLNERVAFEQFQFDILGETCDSLIRLWTSKVQNIDYQWYRNGIAIPGATEPELHITNQDSSGIYVLRAHDGTNCQLSNEFAHFPIHHRTFIDTSICRGEPLTFLNQMYSTDARDTFHLTNRFGCDSTIFLKVSLKDTTSSRIDTSICLGQEVNIAGRTYTSAGQYQLTTTNTEGCDSFIYLSIRLSDTFHITRDTVLCAGEGFYYQGKYMDSSGVYRFNLESSGACDSLVTWRVNVNNHQYSQLDTFLCRGDSLRLGDTSVRSSGVYIGEFTNQWGCDSLVEWTVQEWERDTLFTDTTLCWDQSIIWQGQTLDQAGQYEVRLSNPDACDTIAILRLDKVEPFEVLSNNVIELNCHDDILLQYQLNVHPTGFYSVYWDDGTIGQERTNLKPGVYTYHIEDSYGCNLTDSLVIRAPQQIQMDLEINNPNCLDTASGRISIHEVSGGHAPHQIFINGRESHGFLKSQVAGHFEIEIIDAKGCKFDTLVTLVQVNKGEMYLSDLMDTFVVGDPVIVEALVNNIDSIEVINWNGWSGLCDHCLSNTLYPGAGTYEISLKVIDQNGCEYFDLVKFVVIQQYWVPNAFTPNGDFINDYFNVFTDRSIEEIDELYIFDRWGEILYKGENLTPGHHAGWDGFYHGQPMPPGVYVYLAHFTDKVGHAHKVSGDFTLIR